MIRFVALNIDEYKEDSHPGSLTDEHEEAEVHQLYERAIKLHHDKKFTEAEECYANILSSPVYEKQSLASLPSLRRIRYLALKNLADLETRSNRKELALKHFAEALDIESDDIVVWKKLGETARDLENYSVAKHAFSMALSKQPSHWASLSNLAEILYILGEYESAEYIIKELAFRLDPLWPRGHQLLELLKSDEQTTTRGQKRLSSDSGISSSDLDELMEKRRKRKKIRETESLAPIEVTLDELAWDNVAIAIMDVCEPLFRTYLDKKNPTQLENAVFYSAPLNITAPSLESAKTEESAKESEQQNKSDIMDVDATNTAGPDQSATATNLEGGSDQQPNVIVIEDGETDSEPTAPPPPASQEPATGSADAPINLDDSEPQTEEEFVLKPKSATTQQQTRRSARTVISDVHKARHFGTDLQEFLQSLLASKISIDINLKNKKAEAKAKVREMSKFPNEAEEVKSFVDMSNGKPLATVLWQFLKTMAHYYHIKWSKFIFDAFISLYDLVVSIQPPHSPPTEDEIAVTLCLAEIMCSKVSTSSHRKPPSPKWAKYRQLTYQLKMWYELYPSVFDNLNEKLFTSVRLPWLMAMFYELEYPDKSTTRSERTPSRSTKTPQKSITKQTKSDQARPEQMLARAEYEKCMKHITVPVAIPNCAHNSLISSTTIKTKLAASIVSQDMLEGKDVEEAIGWLRFIIQDTNKDQTDVNDVGAQSELLKECLTPLLKAFTNNRITKAQTPPTDIEDEFKCVIKMLQLAVNEGNITPPDLENCINSVSTMGPHVSHIPMELQRQALKLCFQLTGILRERKGKKNAATLTPGLLSYVLLFHLMALDSRSFAVNELARLLHLVHEYYGHEHMCYIHKGILLSTIIKFLESTTPAEVDVPLPTDTKQNKTNENEEQQEEKVEESDTSLYCEALRQAISCRFSLVMPTSQRNKFLKRHHTCDNVASPGVEELVSLYQHIKPIAYEQLALQPNNKQVIESIYNALSLIHKHVVDKKGKPKSYAALETFLRDKNASLPPVEEIPSPHKDVYLHIFYLLGKYEMLRDQYACIKLTKTDFVTLFTTQLLYNQEHAKSWFELGYHYYKKYLNQLSTTFSNIWTTLKAPEPAVLNEHNKLMEQTVKCFHMYTKYQPGDLRAGFNIGRILYLQSKLLIVINRLSGIMYPQESINMYLQALAYFRVVKSSAPLVWYYTFMFAKCIEGVLWMLSRTRGKLVCYYSPSLNIPMNMPPTTEDTPPELLTPFEPYSWLACLHYYEEVKQQVDENSVIQEANYRLHTLRLKLAIELLRLSEAKQLEPEYNSIIATLQRSCQTGGDPAEKTIMVDYPAVVSSNVSNILREVIQQEVKALEEECENTDLCTGKSQFRLASIYLASNILEKPDPAKALEYIKKVFDLDSKDKLWNCYRQKDMEKIEIPGKLLYDQRRYLTLLLQLLCMLKDKATLENVLPKIQRNNAPVDATLVSHAQEILAQLKQSEAANTAQNSSSGGGADETQKET